MGGKSKSQMQRPDVRSCSYWLLHDRLFTTRYDEKTRKGEGEKNKMPRKKFSHSKFLKQNTPGIFAREIADSKWADFFRNRVAFSGAW